MAVQLYSEIPESTDFCFRNGFSVPELPWADELFFNGKIRPKQPNPLTFNGLHPPPVSAKHNSVGGLEEKKITRLKEFLLMSDADDDDDPADHENNHPGFGQFKRSSSLSCERTESKGLIKSSLRLLGRSNSTGCAPDPEKRRRLQKQPSIKCPPGWAGDQEFHGCDPIRKPAPLKNWRSASTGVRVSPVLSLPQLFVANGTVDLFGLTSLFCNGKVKKKKKG